MATKAYPETFNLASFILSLMGIAKGEAAKFIKTLPADVIGEMERLPLPDTIEFLTQALQTATEEVVSLTEREAELIRAVADEKVKTHRALQLVRDLPIAIGLVLREVIERQDKPLNFWLVKSSKIGGNGKPTTLLSELRHALNTKESPSIAAASVALAKLIQHGPYATYQCGHDDEDCPPGCPRIHEGSVGAGDGLTATEDDLKGPSH